MSAPKRRKERRRPVCDAEVRFVLLACLCNAPQSTTRLFRALVCWGHRVKARLLPGSGRRALTALHRTGAVQLEHDDGGRRWSVAEGWAEAEEEIDPWWHRTAQRALEDVDRMERWEREHLDPRGEGSP